MDWLLSSELSCICWLMLLRKLRAVVDAEVAAGAIVVARVKIIDVVKAVLLYLVRKILLYMCVDV